MFIEGQATPAGTQRYASRYPELNFRPAGGWQVAPAGFGGYRVDVTVPEHHQALADALRAGINLIDTSANYSDGGSEEMISRVLGDLIAAGAIQRDEIVIVTKGGYIQGTNFKHSQQRRDQGAPWPDLVTYMPGLEHCIHPEFLRDQIDRSLMRLNADHVDVYLLHNPEYFLMQAHKDGQPLPEARAEYARRLKMAFAYLETEVAQGRISAYGVSSNTFVTPADDPGFTALEDLWRLAQQVRADHHFGFIQLPLNLYETGAAVVQNQSDGATTLELAARLGLAVLVNRPLNAIGQDQLIRLTSRGGPAQPAAFAGGAVQELSTTVDSLIAVEMQLPELLAASDLPEAESAYLQQIATTGRILQANWQAVGNYVNWQLFVDNHLLPRLQRTAQILGNRPNLLAAARSWLNEYASLFNAVERAISLNYQRQAGQWAAREQARLAAAMPDWAAPTLSQTALRAVRSAAGVTSVLVGMRHPDYVRDVVAELGRPVAAVDAAGWRALPPPPDL